MLIHYAYNRENALAYARRWALSRNPLFADFTGGGGNCTNFVSQCVLAGSCRMNFTPTFGWYYLSVSDRAPAWPGVKAFYDFFTGSGDFEPNTTRHGPYGREVDVSGTMVGDVIQLANEEGVFYHSLFISGYEDDDILVCAHSNDALDRRLSTYNYASNRFIHIEGVNLEVSDSDCFTALIEGLALPT